jgi:hypothetical protein
MNNSLIMTVNQSAQLSVRPSISFNARSTSEVDMGIDLKWH